jgi:glycosyltransferase involved in cell wall biosynthesis
MRVLLTNTRHFFGGGDSTYTFYLSELLKRNGHDVAFFAMEDAQNLQDSNSDLFVSYIDFKDLNRNKSILNGFKALRRVIYSSEARRKFGQMIDRFQPDIIHLQNIHAHITPSVIIEANKLGLPVVWTLHDYRLICPNSHFMIDATSIICEACGKGSFYQAALKRCKKRSFLASVLTSIEAYTHCMMGVRDRVDRFLAPSAFLRNKLIDKGFPPEKVIHLPLFLPDRMYSHTDYDDGYLLFLGKLDPIKGIYPLLKACRQVSEVRLLIAGRVEESIGGQLSELLPSNAEYVGMRQGEELRRLLFGARAVVVPSLCYENQPFSITEPRKHRISGKCHALDGIASRRGSSNGKESS